MQAHIVSQMLQNNNGKRLFIFRFYFSEEKNSSFVYSEIFLNMSLKLFID